MVDFPDDAANIFATAGPSRQAVEIEEKDLPPLPTAAVNGQQHWMPPKVVSVQQSTIPNAIRKTSSAILLVFQFMQCCIVPENDSVCATPAAASPYSRLTQSPGFPSPARGPSYDRHGSNVTERCDSMESQCVTLRNCPLFCDDIPTDEPDLPTFASIPVP